MQKIVFPKIFFLMMLVITAPACRRWRKTQKEKMQLLEYAGKQVAAYSLIINGIECKQCIHAVLKKLGKIQGIHRVTCVCPKNDYTKSRIECTVTKTADGFPFEQIKKVLSVDDFILARVFGEFSGIVTKASNNTFSFKMFGQEGVFDCSIPEIVLAEWIQQQITTRDIKAFGVLDIENKRFTIEQML